MLRVKWDEAQTQLDALIDAALKGEMVIIERDAEHAVQITPMQNTLKERVFGSGASGLIWMSDNFDDELEDFKDYMP